MQHEVRAVPIGSKGVPTLCVVLAEDGDRFLSRDMRIGSRLVLEIKDVLPASGSFDASRMERHPASIQAFVPMTGTDYVVVLCGSDAQGNPDICTLQALRVPGRIAVQYLPGVWHLPIRTLGAAGRFCVIENTDGGTSDCEWIDTEKFSVQIFE